MGGVLRGVGEVHAQAHHRRLMAHRVHPGQGAADGVGVPYVGGRVGPDVVQDGLVTVCHERLDDLGPDETGTAGDQYAHALTLGP